MAPCWQITALRVAKELTEDLRETEAGDPGAGPAHIYLDPALGLLSRRHKAQWRSHDHTGQLRLTCNSKRQVAGRWRPATCSGAVFEVHCHVSCNTNTPRVGRLTKLVASCLASVKGIALGQDLMKW